MIAACRIAPSWLVVMVLGSYWIYFRGGAEELARHTGLLRGVRSAGSFKLVWAIVLIAGVIGLVLMRSAP